MQAAAHESFQPLDPGRVNTMDPVELAYWCQQLQCTPETLQQVVARVGEHVSVVRQALEQAQQAQ
jgi:hypothetical protein